MSNKVILDFYMDELDLLDDNVVDVVNGRNFDDGSLESEKKTERDIVGTSSVYDKGGDKYDDDDKIEVIIFLPMRKDFNSLMNRKKMDY